MAIFPVDLVRLSTGGLRNLNPSIPFGTHRVTGERRVPGPLAGVDRAPILNDDMHVAIEISNEAGVAAVRRILDSDAHVLPRFAVKQIVINVDVWILIVREVVVDQRFAIDPFRAGDPLRKTFCDRAVMDPVFHVATLPGVVSAFAGLQAPRRVELIRKSRGLQRDVESFQRCRFRFERR